MLELKTFCETCYAKLHHSGMACELYTNFLSWYLGKGRCAIIKLSVEKQMPVICWLERNKYILTSDFELDYIKVKPLGLNQESDGYHLCLDRKSHG